MPNFRFIHAADIHLGSMLHLNADDALLQGLSRDAVYTAFDRICDTAVKEGVRFIVISGDLYDKEFRSVRANRYFADACGKLNNQGIDVYLIAGNHDPMSESKELFTLSPNVHIFPADKPHVFEVCENNRVLARIMGQSYFNKSEPEAIHMKYPTLRDDAFNIALLHTQMVSNDKKYVPAAVNELLGNNTVHYWALGHIHQPDVLWEDKPVIAWSGIPQGRDFGEEGPGGCWLVEVGGTEIISRKYIVTSSVIYKRIQIDISDKDLCDADRIDQLEDYIESFARKSAEFHNTEYAGVKGFAVRWEITGRGPLHYSLTSLLHEDDDGIAESLRRRLSDLKPFIWTDSIQVRTEAPSESGYGRESEVLTRLLDQAVHSALSDGKTKDKVAALLGRCWTLNSDHEELDEKKLVLDDDTLGSIIHDARQLLIDGLSGGSGQNAD